MLGILCVFWVPGPKALLLRGFWGSVLVVEGLRFRQSTFPPLSPPPSNQPWGGQDKHVVVGIMAGTVEGARNKPSLAA